jgi:hypothetical protein
MVSGIQGSGMASLLRPMGPPPELSDDQKEQVKSILSKYDKSKITMDDAKAIFQAFQDAGIKGPGLKEAIEETGFDAEQLRTLAKPDWIPNPPSGSAGGSNNSQGINISALQSLQSILSQYDLTSLSSDKQNDLLTQLTQSGLVKAGYIINLGA